MATSWRWKENRGCGLERGEVVWLRRKKEQDKHEKDAATIFARGSGNGRGEVGGKKTQTSMDPAGKREISTYYFFLSSHFWEQVPHSPIFLAKWAYTSNSVCVFQYNTKAPLVGILCVVFEEVAELV